MESLLRYRGRTVTGDEIAFIRALIAEHPQDSRRALSQRLCEAWGWVQANGAPRDMVCRGLMLALHRAGHITLPPVRWRNPNPFLERRAPAPVTLDQSPIGGTVADLRPLEFRQVRRTAAEALFNGLIATYHYLGYCQPVGEQLKYVVFAGERPIACLAWSSAPRHIGCRDRFIGWSAATRMRNLSQIACNTRFLLLPWVRVACLASHILGAMVRLVPRDWQRLYRHPLYYLETFVDEERFAGTCYRAANWRCLGRTTGRGKNDQTRRPNRSRKAVWGYPLGKDFRERLCEEHP